MACLPTLHPAPLPCSSTLEAHRWARYAAGVTLTRNRHVPTGGQLGAGSCCGSWVLGAGCRLLRCTRSSRCPALPARRRTCRTPAEISVDASLPRSCYDTKAATWDMALRLEADAGAAALQAEVPVPPAMRSMAKRCSCANLPPPAAPPCHTPLQSWARRARTPAHLPGAAAARWRSGGSQTSLHSSLKGCTGTRPAGPLTEAAAARRLAA